MEIRIEKAKLVTNSDNGIQRDKGKGTDVGYCNKLQVLGSVVSDNVSKPENL